MIRAAAPTLTLPRLRGRGARLLRAGGGFAFAAMLAVVLLVGLAGCGKRSDLDPPPGEPVTYPRQYPHP